MFRDLLNAISFLTIFPLREQAIRRDSVYYFPAAGLLLGIITSAAYFLFSMIFPLNACIVLALIVCTLLNGGLHLDGFADTVDGLSGGRGNRARVLEIMSDSHIGAHGVVALILLLGLKFSLIASLSSGPLQTSLNSIYSNNLLKALILMPVTGRWSMLISMYYSKPAKKDGLGALFIEYSKSPKIIISTIFTLVLCLLAFGFAGAMLLIPLFISALLFTGVFSKKTGGMTGDTIGSINEINEVIFLICIFLTHNLHI